MPRWKPLYKSSSKVGAALTAVPPFQFHGVTARVFPLPANIASLNAFCDSYLNMDIPRSIAYFRPLLPYVYLVVLDYGDMSVDVGKRFWVSQREVSFAVPLERYKADKEGRLTFQDFALVHPFIFVDDEWSLMTGREVYGWPKVLATMDADVNEWADDPRGRTRLLSMSTEVFRDTYANEEMEKRTLLEVYSAPELSFSQIPFDVFNPLNPVTALQNAVRGGLSLAGDLLDSALRLNVRGFEPTHTPDVLRQMFGYSLDLAQSVLPDALLAFWRSGGDASSSANESSEPKLVVNNVNLKQFRDAEHPDLPCYQELNYSVMGMSRLNRAGLLGDTKLLLGDTSGGFRVALHRYASQPIIETLGLQVEEEWDKDGDSGSILRPVLPFWCDVEFHYGRGYPLCWRTAETSAKDSNHWRENRREDPTVSDSLEPRAVSPEGVPEYDLDHWRDVHTALGRSEEVLYNAARGAALQAVPGPFDFPDVTLRVFPLLADPSKLRSLCNDYLNTDLESAGLRFEPFGRYVYLTANSYGTQHGVMTSETNNIGAWRERELDFKVPVKWYRKIEGAKGKKGDADAWELIGVALLSPFSFANMDAHVASDREITGCGTEKADIESPPMRWLEESGPVAENTYLTLSAEVLPALGVGQKAVHRPLVEIEARDTLRYNDAVNWRFIAETWGKTLADELKRKVESSEDHGDRFQQLKGLALRLLGSHAPFNEIVLRQCRDSSDPLHACYQALLSVETQITKVYDLRELEERVHVAIHAYPSHPIVEVLGLETKATDARDESVIHFLQPVRPFWARVAMRESLARTICRRETVQWEKPRLKDLLHTAASDAAPDLSKQLEDVLKEVETSPQRIGEKLQAIAHADSGAALAILRTIVQREDMGDPDAPDPVGPQMAIESILSEEWEHWGAPRWWRRTKGGEKHIQQKPDFCIRRDTIGSSEQELFLEREGLKAWERDGDWLVPK
jgi:hypothetical protein